MLLRFQAQLGSGGRPVRAFDVGMRDWELCLDKLRGVVGLIPAGHFLYLDPAIHALADTLPKSASLILPAISKQDRMQGEFLTEVLG